MPFIAARIIRLNVRTEIRGNSHIAFQLTDRHHFCYKTNGYAIFEQLVPKDFLKDLRVAAEAGRAILRATCRQAQRLQPIAQHDVDLRPFRELYEFPELVNAIRELLTEEHSCGMGRNNPLAGTSILYEPADHSYCTPWHRDWRDNRRGLDINAWRNDLTNVNLFNQINCALYEDHSLWIVPGSHSRDDLLAEAERFPDRPILSPEFDKTDSEDERQRRCITYCRSMPGAQLVNLNGGDFMVYRNSLWHLGNYKQHIQRATIHDFLTTPAFVEWVNAPPMTGTDEWMNPNA